LSEFDRFHNPDIPNRIYYRAKVKPQLSKEASRRYGILQKFWMLRRKKIDIPTACKILEVKKATLYRWQRKYQQSHQSLKPKSRRPKNLRKPE
jgi:transposase